MIHIYICILSSYCYVLLCRILDRLPSNHCRRRSQKFSRTLRRRTQRGGHIYILRIDLLQPTAKLLTKYQANASAGTLPVQDSNESTVQVHWALRRPTLTHLRRQTTTFTPANYTSSLHRRRLQHASTPTIQVLYWSLGFAPTQDLLPACWTEAHKYPTYLSETNTQHLRRQISPPTHFANGIHTYPPRPLL